MSKLGLGTVQFGTDYGLNSVDGQVRPKEVKHDFRGRLETLQTS